jgi:hypothetical protein
MSLLRHAAQFSRQFIAGYVASGRLMPEGIREGSWPGSRQSGPSVEVVGRSPCGHPASNVVQRVDSGSDRRTKYAMRVIALIQQLGCTKSQHPYLRRIPPPSEMLSRQKRDGTSLLRRSASQSCTSGAPAAVIQNVSPRYDVYPRRHAVVDVQTRSVAHVNCLRGRSIRDRTPRHNKGIQALTTLGRNPIAAVRQHRERAPDQCVSAVWRMSALESAGSSAASTSNPKASRCR